jgi:P27 family predicted phage terminase small subunit
MGFADEADRFAFEAAAEVMDQLRAAQAHVKKYGQIILVSEGDHSVWKRNPSVGIAQRCHEFLRLCRGDLGLSPAARAKFATGASQDVDPFEELFSR